jgi:prepilin-type N-terminal cleavage/methylation domain-containing protein
MKRHGYTLIELVLVMFLLVLVAFFVFTLAGAGSQAFLRLSESQRQQAELRIAVSYLDVKIKKADHENGLSIKPNPYDASQSALRLTESINGIEYLTWIFWRDGKLQELVVDANATLTPEMGTPIATLAAIQLKSLSPHLLQVTVTADPGSDSPVDTQVSRIFFLRSGGLTP